jgi:hypothetical protein
MQWKGRCFCPPPPSNSPLHDPQPAHLPLAFLISNQQHAFLVLFILRSHIGLSLLMRIAVYVIEAKQRKLQVGPHHPPPPFIPPIVTISSLLLQFRLASNLFETSARLSRVSASRLPRDINATTILFRHYCIHHRLQHRSLHAPPHQSVEEVEACCDVLLHKISGVRQSSNSAACPPPIIHFHALIDISPDDVAAVASGTPPPLPPSSLKS